MDIKNKDIVFIVNAMGRGGASRVISILANHYATKNWNVTLIIRKIAKAYPLDSRINIIELGWHKLFRIQLYRHIRKYIMEHQGCTVVAFQPRVNMITVLAAKGLNARVIISERNDIKVANPEYLFRLTDNIYSRKEANAVVFQSERVKNYYCNTVKDKGHIVLNPVSVKCLASTQKKHKIVNFGRLDPQKNQALLIKAFSRIKEKYPDYDLYIYGEGVLRNDLENLAQQLGITESVHFPGNVPDIHEKISDAEMFVLSSDFEGLSNALLESMMMGLPCISTACAGSDEIIHNGENGILIPIKDEEKLYSAMLTLIENEALRNSIAEQARRDSEQFKYDNIISRWERIFENR